MKKLKLACMPPWGSPFVWTKSVKSMLKLRNPEDCEVQWFFPETDPWCSSRRHNDCLEQAKYWGADLCVFLGADQTYPKDMLERLIARYREGYEAITLRVPIRGHVPDQGSKPFQPIVWRYIPDENGNIITGDRSRTEMVGPDRGMVRVHGSGSGVLMFETSALDHIKPPWFFETPIGPTFERKACADWPFVNRLQIEAEVALWCDTDIHVGHLHDFTIDETYQERFSDWETSGDKAIRGVAESDQSKIEQVRMSPAIPFYKDKFERRYNLREYYNPHAPAFFFGCYNAIDLKAIQDHQSIAVIIWAGTDALNMRKALGPLGKHPFGQNVRHVAISKFIADDLDALGLKYVRLPFCNVDEGLFKPVPRAGKRGIFAFVPTGDEAKYGGPFIDELQKLLPDFEWVVQRDRNATPEQMREMYERCFVGVRPLTHDGLSNTVVEMGLMGRRVLWEGAFNGDSTNAVLYRHPSKNDLQCAAEMIREVYARQDEDYFSPQAIAARVRNWLKLPEGWNTTKFYDPPTLGIIPAEVRGKDYDYREYFDARYKAGPRGAGGPEPQQSEDIWVQKQVSEYLSGMGGPPWPTVLDVGCGSAARLRDIRLDAEEDYTGVDISPVAIEHAKAAFPNTNFIVADITKDDIPEADAVLAIDVMQHIKHEDFNRVIDKLLAAARKVLIIKVTVGVEDGYYQFSHDWTNYDFERVPVLGVDSRLIVIQKEPAYA